MKFWHYQNFLSGGKMHNYSAAPLWRFITQLYFISLNSLAEEGTFLLKALE